MLVGPHASDFDFGRHPENGSSKCVIETKTLVARSDPSAKGPQTISTTACDHGRLKESRALASGVDPRSVGFVQFAPR
jgi:hypothetical protein